MVVTLNEGLDMTDNEAFKEEFTRLITERLWWYSPHIIHVSASIDVCTSITGQDNKACTLDVLIAYMQPIIVTCYAKTYYGAVEAAVHQLKSKLETKLTAKRDKESKVLYTAY
jgi:hypothetical protein